MPRTPSGPLPKLTSPPVKGSHEIGYAKPPVATRFKPGKSGNPRGRPKGSKNRLPHLNEERLKDIVQIEAYREIKVNDGARQITIPMAQAIIRTLAVGAAKGLQRSQRLFTELLMMTEKENRAQYEAWMDTAIEYRNGWGQELARRQALGIEAEDPVPHPEDIIFDSSTGQIRIHGPTTKEEKVKWDGMRQRVLDCDEEIAYLRKQLIDRKRQNHRQFIEQDIAHEQRIRQIIVGAIGEPPEWFIARARTKKAE